MKPHRLLPLVVLVVLLSAGCADGSLVNRDDYKDGKSARVAQDINTRATMLRQAGVSNNAAQGIAASQLTPEAAAARKQDQADTAQHQFEKQLDQMLAGTN